MNALPILRPVSWETSRKWRASTQSGVGGHYETTTNTGHFHSFITEGNVEDGFECMAVVETDEGYVETVGAHKIQFMDRG